MGRTRHFAKRHMVLVGALIAVIPLALLVKLQHGWLVRLERTSAIAHKAYLTHYLEAVTNDVQFFYRKNAERVLNLPASYFVDDRLENAAYLLRKKGVDGAKRLFFVHYRKGLRERLFAFDPVTWNLIPGNTDVTPGEDEVKAILVALAPWKLLAERGVEVDTAHLAVDERDPENRIILNPIIDRYDHVVGVAGMIVDNTYFKKRLLPTVIEKSLSAYFEDALDALESLIVRVKDGQGRLVMATHEAEGLDNELRRGFDFIFTDWRLELNSHDMTLEQWARTNFAVNMGLSVLLALLLLGGIMLTLRMASREMKLSQMKNEFVSNVSHELRTPVASVRVFGEFLRLGRVESAHKVREYGEYIETESRRLTQLINNILDFSRIESGQKTYRLVAGDVQTVVDDLLHTFSIRLKHLGLEIHYEAPRTPLPAVRFDDQAIAQALSNLLDNAVKYSGESNHIGLRVAQETDSVVIAVQDHGLGITRAEQLKIFEPFHRVSTGLVHDVKGSGLGLAIVQHIVEAHGGSITVDSEVGKGSTFSIHLPVDGTNVEVRAPGEMELGVESHA
ncbi:MAG: sensor histidine kinase [Acidobacteriota bacterium]